jgi:hypothetical protein
MATFSLGDVNTVTFPLQFRDYQTIKVKAMKYGYESSGIRMRG